MKEHNTHFVLGIFDRFEDTFRKLVEVFSVSTGLRMATHHPKRKTRPATYIISDIFWCITSSLLTWAAFPAVSQNWLIWIALVPLIFSCRSARPHKAFFLGLIYGSLSIMLICSWIYSIPGFSFYHALPLSLYLGLYPACWCAVCALWSRTEKSFSFIGASLWVLCDFLKNHAGFLSFPLASLAQSQHENLPLLQICQYTGEYGVTFIVVLVNIALVELILKQGYRMTLFVLVILGGIYGLGFIELQNNINITNPQIAVTVIQPNISREERHTPAGRNASFLRLLTLTREGTLTDADLILLPETAIRNDEKGSSYVEKLRMIATTSDIPIIYGASDIEKFKVEQPSVVAGTEISVKKNMYNSAYCLYPDGRLSTPYRKIIRFPFGEYDPISPSLRVPKWFIPDLVETKAGDAYYSFILPGNSVVVPAICWEILFADFFRGQTREKKADLVVNLTNDNWFGLSAAPLLQNSGSVFRAVESRTPVAISSNTGPSQIVNAYGGVVARHTGLFQAGVLHAKVTKGSFYKRTIYSRYGDLFALTCLALFVMMSASFYIHRLYTLKIC